MKESSQPNSLSPSVEFPVKRVLLKISGEALMGDQSSGIHPEVVARIAGEIQQVHDMGIQICIVIGGGNIFRGVLGEQHGIDRTTSDHMGMLATVINALALQGALEKLGVDVRIQSAIPMDTICESYIRRRAMAHLYKRRVVIFAAGSGNPYFTTDTAAVLRASEMNCDVLAKGTKVNGIYEDDPKKNPTCKRYDSLTYEQVIREKLNVMDMAAIALARDNQLPVIVFSIQEQGNFMNIVKGQGTFTIVNTKEA